MNNKDVIMHIEMTPEEYEKELKQKIGGVKWH